MKILDCYDNCVELCQTSSIMCQEHWQIEGKANTSEAIMTIKDGA